MRGLAVLTSLLVLLAPLAASQSGDESGSTSSSSSSSSGPAPSNSTSSGPSANATEDASGDDDDDADGDDVECPLPERRPMSEPEKVACYCRDNPRDPRCDRGDGDAEAEAADRQAGAWRRWCRDEARADAQRDRCRQALSEFGDDQGRDRRITFTVDAANRTLLDYAIDGRVVLAAIALDPGSDNLTVHRAGSTLRLGDADSELVLHDDPTGLVRFKGADGSVTVRLAEGATAATASDGSVARVTFADGTVGHLRLGNATWIDGETVLAAGFFAFLLPPGQEERAAGDGGDGDGDAAEAAEVEEKVGRAITRSRVGAEISVNAPAPAAAAALSDESEGTVDILAYDDVEVEVNVPSEAATPDAPIRVKVSAELDEGRTIVLNLDRSVLESAKAESLVLRYYDLYSQPDGTEVQTEVLFAQAGGLEDILDPSDDSGQPEYWVVEDANGLQVLVSVPHWSAHAVTIGSVLASNPSVLAGVLVGLAGSAVAAAAMLWPRRREDEE